MRLGKGGVDGPQSYPAPTLNNPADARSHGPESSPTVTSARLAAARRDALTALVDDLRAQNQDAQAALETAAAQNAAAAKAWQSLAKAGAGALPEILSAMDGANPLAANWLRAAVDTIASRASRSSSYAALRSCDIFTVRRSFD